MIIEKDQFFQAMDEHGLALTYDDVTIPTCASDVSRDEVDLSTRFTRNLVHPSPLASAAMDTVTMSDMAIAQAIMGGIGPIPYNLSPDDQRLEVRKVKRYMNGLITDPRTAQVGQTLQEVLNESAEYDADFRTFPVVNGDNRFVGLLTGYDFDRYGDELSTTVAEAMTPAEKVTVGETGTQIKDAYRIMREIAKKTLPIVDSDGRIEGLYLLSDVSRIVGGNRGMSNLDSEGRLRAAITVPTDPEEALTRLGLVERYVDVIIIDSAQGDSKYTFQTLKALKEATSSIDIMVGNITNPESARRLAEEGADGIKVGQGPGSICTTRTKLGIGTPQVTAVYECAKAVEDLGVPVCADGGIRDSGDIAKALAAGACSIMAGNLFAGTDESPGEIIESGGYRYKRIRGMGSAEALNENIGTRKRYGLRGVLAPEGVTGEVLYKGSVHKVGAVILEYLRGALSHNNSPNIETFRRTATFRQMTPAGRVESNIHDLTIL